MLLGKTIATVAVAALATSFCINSYASTCPEAWKLSEANGAFKAGDLALSRKLMKKYIATHDCKSNSIAYAFLGIIYAQGGGGVSKNKGLARKYADEAREINFKPSFSVVSAAYYYVGDYRLAGMFYALSNEPRNKDLEKKIISKLDAYQVNVDAANLRSRNSQSSEKIGQVYSNEKVYELMKFDDWVSVYAPTSSGQKVGYIYSDLISR